MRRFALHTCCYLLALDVAAIMVRIEWLNAQAGGILPRHEYRNQDSAEGLVKWRGSLVTTEARWREAQAPKGEHPTSNPRPLTTAESETMNREIRQAIAENELHSVVESAGLAQYLLVPALIACSLFLIRRNGVRYGLAPLVIGIVAGAAMLYRGYFSSLAW